MILRPFTPSKVV